MAGLNIDQKMIFPEKTISQETGKFVVLNKGTSIATFTAGGDIQEISPKSKITVDFEATSSHPHVKIVPEIQVKEKAKKDASRIVSNKTVEKATPTKVLNNG